MDVADMNMEILECARYGEDDDLRQLLVAGAEVNFADDFTGNTAMHRAAANNHLSCLMILKEFGAEHMPNLERNLPIHYAALNGAAETLKFLLENYEVDVLSQNSFGRSTLTEAFTSKNADAIELCLSHSSASEEKLIETPIRNKESMSGTESVETTQSTSDKEEGNAILHEMNFEISLSDETSSSSSSPKKNMFVRELPITRADSPFGSDSAPEDDTTGLGIWPAALLTARWAILNKDMMEGKVIAELGAGCGVPALAVAFFCNPRLVYLTDIHMPTLRNACHNCRLNGTRTAQFQSFLDNQTLETTSLLPPQPPTEPLKLQQSLYSAAASLTSDELPPQGIGSGRGGEILEEVVISHSNTADDAEGTTIRVTCLSWQDEKTYPKEKIDVLLGSDLVYDEGILSVLVPTVNGLLNAGGSFLYVAPNEGRAGMHRLLESMAEADIPCIEQLECNDEMFSNPLCGEDCSDLYVLHFYDLPAKKPHTLYHFRKST